MFATPIKNPGRITIFGSARPMLQQWLEQEGHSVNVLPLEVAPRWSDTDVLIIDVPLARDAWELCGRLRARTNLPIVVATDSDDSIDRILTLEMGADVVLSSPHPGLVAAFARTLLRRTQVARHAASASWEPADAAARLTTIETMLLNRLAEAPGHAVTRRELIACVWGQQAHVTPRLVDVHIKNLRRKLGTDSIDAVWGVGYKLVA